MIKVHLTSAEAAELLAVSPSSIKRWADTGVLECVKTAGRHRRFERAVVERFRSRFPAGVEPASDAASSDHSWFEFLVEQPSPLALDAKLEEAHTRLGAWWSVADSLAPSIAEVGLRWEAGQLDILREHDLSERLARALARVAGSIRVPARSPLALLTLAEDEEHALGLALLEVCLREAGFRVDWGGRRTPLAQVLAAVEVRRVAMVAVSASEAYHQTERLAEQARALDRSCAANGVDLLLGGRGPWPTDLAHAKRLWTFAELHGIYPGKL